MKGDMICSCIPAKTCGQSNQCCAHRDPHQKDPEHKTCEGHSCRHAPDGKAACVPVETAYAVPVKPAEMAPAPATLPDIDPGFVIEAEIPAPAPVQPEPAKRRGGRQKK